MDIVFRSLFAVIISTACFTGSIKTAGIYYAKARYPVPKAVAFFAAFCVLLILDLGNYLISSLLRHTVLIGFMFVFFKGEKREKLGMFTVSTAMLEFARNGIGEILGACVIRWQEYDIIQYTVGSVSWIAAALIVCILFLKTKVRKVS